MLWARSMAARSPRMRARCCSARPTKRSASCRGWPIVSRMAAIRRSSSTSFQRCSASAFSASRSATRISIDHDQLRHDPVLGVLGNCLTSKRSDCAPLAGKSTLNRLEHAAKVGSDPYHKITHDPAAIERLFVTLLMDAYDEAAAPADHRHRRHPRSDPRRTGRPALQRLLRLLLLSAAVHLLRPAPAGRQASQRRQGCGRWRQRGDRAHRGADPRALAGRAHHPARRQRLRARRLDGMVRKQRR